MWAALRTETQEDNHDGPNTEPAVVMPTSDPSETTWLPPTPEGWTSGPLPATPSYPQASSNLNFIHGENNSLEPAGLESSTSDANTARFERIHFATDIPSTSLQQTPPSTTQPQAASEPPVSVEATDLQNYLYVNSPNTRRLVELFFREIHPYWAILHAPTFELEKSPPVLVASMVILASWLEKGPDHEKLAQIVFDEVSRIRMVWKPDPALAFSTDGMVPKALNLTGLLVSTCRLAFSVLRVDAYLSMLLDHPPSVRYQELWIPLPKSSRLWAAANEPERRELQWNEPAGREKALFSFFMRDALNPYRGKLPYCLTDIDYHLSTCAAQTTIWEFAREAHSSMSDELADEISPGVFVDMARPQLTLWRDKRKQDYPLLEQYFSGNLPGSDHLLAPLTFTLMYMATLKMFAPMNVLRIKGHYYKSRPGAAIPTRKPQAHLHSWISTGCPRAALWNAAQICRIFTIESTRTDCDSSNGSTCPLLRARLRLNPLLIPGVLMSAIVACSYARLKGRCASCRSDEDTPDEPFPPPPPDEQSATFQAWKDQGTPIPYWGGICGSESVRVCKCQLSKLAAWFRGAFAEDEAAEMEFVLFLAELSGETK
ncbi:hypothetical protein Daesc_005617 [Daldinia eschscholtzii]|uniref:Transcription factor domain-containing protein n=1 Tax=Daldinia eschscholtzii TaxID=292717 RepID=A0AAX6MKZ6_9PEZI